MNSGSSADFAPSLASRACRHVTAAPWVWLVAFVLIWTAVNAIGNSATALNQDMAEAFSWSQHFRLGYIKHPPLWAWVAGLWFTVAPSTVTSFALLSAINAALGLYGAWLLIGQFTEGDKRMVATVLLVVSPLYTLDAYKYNANTLFLSLWPWCAYLFVRSLREARSDIAIAFGVVAGLAMLTKYYAVVLLATCALAALTHPLRPAYFASRRPYLAVAACVVVLLPHVYWLFSTGFLPFHYFYDETGRTGTVMLRATTGQIARYIGDQIVILGIVWLVRGGRRPAWRAWLRDQRLRLLLILSLAPFLITYGISLIFRNYLSSNTAMSIFCLLPLLLLELFGVEDFRRASRLAWTCVVAFFGLALVISPFGAYARASGLLQKVGIHIGSPDMDEPSQELALVVTQLWHDAFHRPLGIVAGTDIYPREIAFYSPDHPGEYIGFSSAYAPWVTPKRIVDEGMLVVCLPIDVECRRAGEPYAAAGRTVGQRTITLRHRAWGHSGRDAQFVLVMVAPSGG